MAFKRIRKVVYRSVLPYLADIGRVGLTVLTIVILSGAAVETVRPGMVFNLMAPQALVGLLILAGGLSLLVPAAPYSIRRRLAFAAVGLVAAGGIWRLVWDYLQSTGSDRTPLTVAAVGMTVLVFAAALRTGRRTVKK